MSCVSPSDAALSSRGWRRLVSLVISTILGGAYALVGDLGPAVTLFQQSLTPGETFFGLDDSSPCRTRTDDLECDRGPAVGAQTRHGLVEAPAAGQGRSAVALATRRADRPTAPREVAGSWQRHGASRQLVTSAYRFTTKRRGRRGPDRSHCSICDHLIHRCEGHPAPVATGSSPLANQGIPVASRSWDSFGLRPSQWRRLLPSPAGIGRIGSTACGVPVEGC